MRTSAADRSRTPAGAGSLAATQAEQLDQACDRFEAGWRGGRRPKIEDHLELAGESLRSALLGELIAIELDWRRRQGDDPRQDEFDERFPADAVVVAAAFDPAATGLFRGSAGLDEPRSAWGVDSAGALSGRGAPSEGSAGFGLDSDETTDHDEAARPACAASAPELRHERFQIGAKLGEGGMGVVYRARDSREGRDVALKVMKAALAGTARRRFEREFRSLSALRHPHCLGVYDYGEVANGPFFTMELFLGQPITSLSARALPERLDPLLQLAHALDYIHGHGIIHRDVKPSNILVRPTSRTDGSLGFEVKLMDFGLAKFYGVKSSLSAEAGFAGTVAYCAPEQLNLDELDHRADLYCLGLVGYELLSGRYPFPEARLAGMRPLMQAQLNDKPRPLAEVNPDVPAPIADAVMKYLRKHPRRRPDSAGLLRSAIAEFLGIDEMTAVSGVSIPSLRPTLSVTGFVCRTSEQELLHEVLRRSLRPVASAGEVPASLIVVSGEPGIGKSSVVQEAERIARGHGCQVYEGRCFDGNLSPFQPFVEIIRQLIAELKLQERREAAAAEEDLTGTHVAGLPAQSLVRLLGIVGDYRAELLRIAPELRKYLPGEAYEQVDYGREADYIYRALAAFFLEIATFQPVCLSFEDLQWVDRSSLDLLRHLAAALADGRRAAAAGSKAAPRLIMVASARSGYAPLEGLVAQLRENRNVLEMRLAPLAELETRELVALRLNCQPEELDDDLVARVHDLCGGNPFFIAETVRDWLEKGAITRTEGDWALATAVADSTDLPETVRDVMRLRLQGLPPKAQQVVAAAAVIGALVDIALLRETLPDLSESDVLDAIDLLLPRRVFRETGDAGRVEFVHDLLRELPYGDLSAARRQSLHRRVGELLEERRAKGRLVSAALLAIHFQNAGEREKVFAYCIEAGEEAIKSYAFEDALDFLNQAKALIPDGAPREERYRLWSLLGSANCASKKTEAAIASYRAATEFAPDRAAFASALVGIGEAQQRAGGLREARATFQRALRETGCCSFGRFGDLCKSVISMTVPIGAPTKNPDQVLRRSRDVAFLATQQLAWVTMTQSRFDYSLHVLRLLSLARSTGDPDQLAHAYSRFAMSLALFGRGGIALRAIPRAERCVENCQSPVIKAFASSHVGTAYHFAGRLARAREFYKDAEAKLEKYAHWHSIGLMHNYRRLCAALGDIANELAIAAKELALSEQTGNIMARSWGEYGLANALARSGRIGEAIERSERAIELSARADSVYTRMAALQTYGFVLMQASRYADARVACESSLRLLSQSPFRMEYTLAAYALLAESILGPDWSGPPGSLGREDRKRAWGVARQAIRAGHRFPNLLPHALRAGGRAARALDKRRKSARLLGQAIDRAEGLGARYDLARALLDASCVIPEKAEEYRRRGQNLLDELGAVVPAAERLSSLT